MRCLVFKRGTGYLFFKAVKLSNMKYVSELRAQLVYLVLKAVVDLLNA